MQIRMGCQHLSARAVQALTDCKLFVMRKDAFHTMTPRDELVISIRPAVLTDIVAKNGAEYAVLIDLIAALIETTKITFDPYDELTSDLDLLIGDDSTLPYLKTYALTHTTLEIDHV